MKPGQFLIPKGFIRKEPLEHGNFNFDRRYRFMFGQPQWMKIERMRYVRQAVESAKMLAIKTALNEDRKSRGEPLLFDTKPQAPEEDLPF